MKVMYLRVGAIGTNCYIIFDEDTMEGAVIDPGDQADSILKAITDEGVKVQYILLTHAHFDHILAVHEVQQATGAKLVLHEADAWLLKPENMGEFSAMTRGYTQPQVTVWAKEGTSVSFGGLTATYLHTPGHTPGSCVIQVEDCLFTGDTLFRHECGRCDLEGGNFDQMLDSLARLSQLEGDFEVLPGHEGFSTLEDERRNNPYIKQALAR